MILEGDGGSRDAVFEVSLSRPATSSFTVDYRTVDGTALAGEDYAARSGEITFSVGQSLASVRVPVLGDGKVEAAESFLLAVDAPAAVAQSTAGTAEILDDDAGAGAGIPSVSAARFSVSAEGTGGQRSEYLYLDRLAFGGGDRPGEGQSELSFRLGSDRSGRYPWTHTVRLP